ncbi:efflux RND transporter periplasmic adaptor subunit [Novosphingobium sediminicola]|uniref:Cobalt-zinc-cadmium efflux system membrane fusion protein n=1 Tax=Novosphingobium sediminicola TaxID=563162 RepID=A0A7W6CH08_9SPHN|nr:efflux RND transporter periplasmic adaptor subunit [Novosphingobium sediminicola]MBB3955320.1 cobalt-zinc-cadmium efflux system membrane fusion protein [Novosphingobium sediminicola]
MKKLPFVALALGLALASCGDEKKAAKPRIDPESVVAGANMQGRVKVAPVGVEAVSDTLRVAGQITFDENRVARIGATVTGRVTDMAANIGQSVGRGTVLGRINSSDLSTQQLAYLRARSQYELNRRAAERAQQLYAADVIAAAELQRRQSEANISHAEMRAAADQLRLLGVSAAALGQLGGQGVISSSTPILSTMNGVVVERNLALGQVVQPADALFVVADLSKLWATALVPEQQVRFVQQGQTVALEIPALGGAKREGKLVYVGQVVDPKTRTVVVRTELDNRGGELKPQMLATMLVTATPEKQPVVPNAAIVRENNKDYVFVETAPSKFRIRAVSLGEEVAGKRVVISGVKPGERIAIEGAFHLNNERNRQALEGQ